jgi:hypothetical protein
MTDMRLGNCSFAGSLPPSWGALSKLAVLYIWGNQLSGELPGSWSSMVSVDDLDLSSNADLTGEGREEIGAVGGVSSGCISSGCVCSGRCTVSSGAHECIATSHSACSRTM